VLHPFNYSHVSQQGPKLGALLGEQMPYFVGYLKSHARFPRYEAIPGRALRGAFRKGLPEAFVTGGRPSACLKENPHHEVIVWPPAQEPRKIR
jgi:hypothetical protein